MKKDMKYFIYYIIIVTLTIFVTIKFIQVVLDYEFQKNLEYFLKKNPVENDLLENMVFLFYKDNVTEDEKYFLSLVNYASKHQVLLFNRSSIGGLNRTNSLVCLEQDKKFCKTIVKVVPIGDMRCDIVIKNNPDILKLAEKYYGKDSFTYRYISKLNKVCLIKIGNEEGDLKNYIPIISIEYYIKNKKAFMFYFN
jgi:hypothetical protein